MAVIHHGLCWDMSPAACAAARTIGLRARAGDDVGLGREGRRAYRQAQARPAIPAAFDLGDADHVARWLAPDAVDPALVTLLAWMPTMTVLADDAAALLALLHRRGGSPVAPLALTGSAFLPFAPAVRRLFGGHAMFRGHPGTLGDWVRVGTLERRLRDAGDPVTAERVADLGGVAPDRRWLVTTTLW